VDRDCSVAMLRAIWRLAPTHHSNVYWPTKSSRFARFIANGLRFAGGGVGTELGRVVAAGLGVAIREVA
jgi:hypothetical protein